MISKMKALKRELASVLVLVAGLGWSRLAWARLGYAGLGSGWPSTSNGEEVQMVCVFLALCSLTDLIMV